MIESFTQEVRTALRSYVYRLIDPRTGETFYVGRGQGDRVFAHAKAELATREVPDDAEVAESADESSRDPDDLKFETIRSICYDGFDVIHVIHRHGMSDEAAREVEAALIDVYPALTNIVGGEGSSERGVMHVKQIVNKYAAETADFREPVLLIKLRRSSIETKGLPLATRLAWVINAERGSKAHYVLPVCEGIIRAVYTTSNWRRATTENFPGVVGTSNFKRWGFEVSEAPNDATKRYCGKRIPEQFVGGQVPIRYAAGA